MPQPERGKPPPPAGRADGPRVYELIGGMQACRRLSERFHDRIAGDSVLGPMFPRDMAPTTEYLALFLAERLGGPLAYSTKRGKTSLHCRHAHLAIGSVEAERWLTHMSASMAEVGIPGGAMALLADYFRDTAASLTDPLLPLYRLTLDQLRELLAADHSLAKAGDHGRTLLRAAAGEWDVPKAALLLEHGADANARDVLGHDPLYRAANAVAPGREEAGRAIVALLVRHGADVNGRSGPGSLTALHAAARRGTVAVAEELLASGAEVEARDSKGETPLRRAVNCGQLGVVRLLLSRGADPLSKDRRGQSPLEASKKAVITEALREAVQGR